MPPALKKGQKRLRHVKYNRMFITQMFKNRNEDSSMESWTTFQKGEKDNCDDERQAVSNCFYFRKITSKLS